MGIEVDHSINNQIGGKFSDGNLVSNNGQYGISIVGQNSKNNKIQGNRIGTDAQGLNAMPNVRTGVLIFNSGNNLIGGDYSTHGNLISGNKRHGINIDGEAGRPIMSTALGGCGFTQNNRIYGNRIGVDITGNQALPNGCLLYTSPSPRD